MKRVFGLGLLAGLAILFAGCGNFSFDHPIGAPTVVVSVGDRSLTQDQNTGNWILAFTLEARTLPGSPGGVVLSFDLESGGQLNAGRRVERCPIERTEPCGPFVSNYTLEFTSLPPEGSYTVTGYRVMGENGAVLAVKLPAPLLIH